MRDSRFRSHVNRIPFFGKWIKQFRYERLKNREFREYTRMSQEEIIQRVSETYFADIGRPLNLSQPRALSEKISRRKLFDRDERFTRLSDKYLVRDWVAKIVDEQYLIPLLGVWDHFIQINFSDLPRSFVLKTNHGSGANMFIPDKDKFDRILARRKFDFWMSIPYTYMGNFEMFYLPIKPRILCETYLCDESPEGALRDYKFLCFHGEPSFVWVDLGRYKQHHRNIYNMNWERMPWSIHYPASDYEVPKPAPFEEMIRVVKALCCDFDHVRVDLYVVKGKVYFGEMTFSSGAGHIQTLPDEVDFMLGDLW